MISKPKRNIERIYNTTYGYTVVYHEKEYNSTEGEPEEPEEGEQEK